MPCDIGFKSYARAVIPISAPLAFKKRTTAPAVDAELMALIGQEDPAFVEWFNELDASPLLNQALAQALAAIGNTSPVSFTVKDSGLSATASYRTAAEKTRAEQIADRVGLRWQAETLAIVAQLLDFETVVSVSMVDGREAVMLEGEKHGSGEVHEYLRITMDPRQGSSIMFEHFSSQNGLRSVRAKFLALAQKLGIRIAISAQQESGSPISSGTVHRHFLKNGR